MSVAPTRAISQNSEVPAGIRPADEPSGVSAQRGGLDLIEVVIFQDFGLKVAIVCKNFSVDFFSDEAYDFMTAEISYGGQILCQINQDQGASKMEIEFFHEQIVTKDQPRMKFDLAEFSSLIEKVSNELLLYR